MLSRLLRSWRVSWSERKSESHAGPRAPWRGQPKRTAAYPPEAGRVTGEGTERRHRKGGGGLDAESAKKEDGWISREGRRKRTAKAKKGGKKEGLKA